MAFTRNVIHDELYCSKFAKEELRLLLAFLNFRGQCIKLLWQIKNYWRFAFSRNRQTCFTVLNNRAPDLLVAWRKHKPTMPGACLQPCSCMQCSYSAADWKKYSIKWSNECLTKLIRGLDVLSLSAGYTVENFCLSWFFTPFSLWWICWQTYLCHQFTQVNKSWIESPYLHELF